MICAESPGYGFRLVVEGWVEILSFLIMQILPCLYLQSLREIAKPPMKPIIMPKANINASEIVLIVLSIFYP